MLRSLWKWMIPGLLLILLAYLLWPLQTDYWDIIRNQNQEEVKRDWMNQGTPADHPNRPNILLIMVDDLGRADLELYDVNGQSPRI